MESDRDGMGGKEIEKRVKGWKERGKGEGKRRGEKERGKGEKRDNREATGRK